MQTVLITGGTGMIGKTLTTLFLEKGYKVIVLTRKDKKSRRLNLSFAKWDVEVSKRENYYGPGLTAVVMRKELK